MTTTLIIAIIIATIIVVAGNLIYSLGKRHGEVEGYQRSLRSVQRTIDVLTEAQKHAGVTALQLKKINRFMEKKTLEKLEDLEKLIQHS